MWIRCHAKSLGGTDSQFYGREHMTIKPYWIEGPWEGKLAMVPRPRGGDWLEDDMLSLRQAELDIIVSLLTSDEVIKLGLDREEHCSSSNGLLFLSFPIVDRSVPASQMATLDFVQRLEKELAKGKKIAIHCRQGIGRSAVIAACLLVLAGLDPEKAFERISAARGYSVPETTEQKQWVRKFANIAELQP